MRRGLLLLIPILFLAGCATQAEQETVVDTVAQTASSDVPMAAEDVSPLLPGTEAPSFTVLTSESETLEFNTTSLERPAVLLFYRGGWCPYCNQQLSGLRGADDQLAEMGYDLFYLSADKPEKLREGSLGDDVPFVLLADDMLKVSQAYGVAFRLEDELVERYKSRGLDLAEAAGADHRMLPAPSIFVIGTDGLIKFQYTNPNYRERIDPALLLAAGEIFRDS